MNLKVAKNLLLSFISLLVISLLSEFALRFFYMPLNSGWGWEDSPRKYLADFQNDFPHQLKVRGQNIKYDDDDFVILLLGDSQVESATCSPENMPERLLEKYLSDKLGRKIKVFSLAASGWGQDQQLIVLEKYYEKFRSDLVLIWVTPKNDFWENTFPDRNTGKTAGHLKPTYKLIADDLSGPFYKSLTYYKNSALMQLFISGYQNLQGETIEQFILEKWVSHLPKPHNNDNSNLHYKNYEFIEIDLKIFSQEVFNYSKNNNLTVLTYEDFVNSRSHFSPYLLNKSERDEYLLKITKRLFEEIKTIANSNGSEMFAFYPLREDYDIVYKNNVNFVKCYHNIDKAYSVKLDYLSTLKEIIPDNQLFYFKIAGKDEICVDTFDRHLNDVGNELVMKEVANHLNGIIGYQPDDSNKQNEI